MTISLPALVMIGFGLFWLGGAIALWVFAFCTRGGNALSCINCERDARFCWKCCDAIGATPPAGGGDALDRDVLRALRALEQHDWVSSDGGSALASNDIAATIRRLVSSGGDRVRVLEMFLGRIFAAQQLNESREFKGGKISGRGSLNEVVAEAREYLNCPLGAVDLPAASTPEPRR